jgi:hypothetical protein
VIACCNKRRIHINDKCLQLLWRAAVRGLRLALVPVPNRSCLHLQEAKRNDISQRVTKNYHIQMCNSNQIQLQLNLQQKEPRNLSRYSSRVEFVYLTKAIQHYRKQDTGPKQFEFKFTNTMWRDSSHGYVRSPYINLFPVAEVCLFSALFRLFSHVSANEIHPVTIPCHARRLPTPQAPWASCWFSSQIMAMNG